MDRGLLTFDAAVGLMKSGGVLLLATDTLPGFHCRADLPDPVARIQALKGRGSDKSLLVIAGSLVQARLVTGVLDGRQAAYCGRCWPGPFSLILPAGGDWPPTDGARGGTVAVRVPALGSLRRLALAVGFPLVSTSANRSGEQPCASLEDARRIFGDQVDGVWQASEPVGAGPADREVCPSALIDLTVWPPVQLRQGPQTPPPVEPGGLDGGCPGV